MGLERLILTLEALNLPVGEPEVPDVYLIAMGDKAQDEILVLANKLRANGVSAEVDLLDRSFKAQMKYADKVAAKYLVVIGDDELQKGVVNVKEMQSGKESQVELKELVGFFGGNK